MKHLVVVVAFALAGCVATPVKRTFPDAPPELKKQCEDLQMISSTNPLAITELLKVVIQNYTLYYQCANRVEGWQEWYDTQKKIFDSVK